MKIMSYNIHSGKNTWMIPSFRKMIRFFQKEQPDVIGLQEVNENNKRGSQVTALEHQLKMNVHFGPHLSIGKGHYGIATLSRFPILDRKQILLTSQKEQRGFLDTVIKVDRKEVHLLNTHLGLNGKERSVQFKEIEQYIRSLSQPFIFLGDFNTIFPELDSSLLIDTGKQSKKEHQSTMMLTKKRIDYIFISKELELINYEVLDVTFSDHYPVVVEVTFKRSRT
ncbi:endonuclease/exonuclease/phosphatase family protein [Tepidibacillus sp. HK-1]|uniref:endonuclease/exonuclease/phosphatase family protein n=1 Tax=Tepidibacillus sp. HK-1 TaxID=1883407 RepID=UPI0008562331|nr:endonuclease/exonuclease/phosphatase family protein [Tepidibacillus sp. HK-1]GBF10671.1 hypothetical protein HK1_00684 [Tepidibacillus sp. HK-1]